MIARVRCSAAANIRAPAARSGPPAPAPSVSRCGNPGTTYQIGHEALALAGRIDVVGVKTAIRKWPAIRIEILIAGVTEVLQTRPDAAGIKLALQMLGAVAQTLDTTPQPKSRK